MIDLAVAGRVLEAALATGADFAELYAEDGEALSIEMSHGKVENVAVKRSTGAGVRILLGTRCVYAHANDLSERALLAIARQAAAALSGVRGQEVAAFNLREFARINPIAIYPGTVPHQDKIALLRAAHKSASGYSAEISQVTCGYTDSDKRVFIANSEGLVAEERRVRTRARVQAVASSGTEYQTGSRAPGRCMGFEAYSQIIDMDLQGREAAQQAVTMLHAEDCPATFAPVVIDGGFGGVIFHEACGHSLEATSVAKGNSEFRGKLGQKIAADCVSAVDDGTMPNEWGSISMDDEGAPTQRNVLIEKGVLTGYLIDKVNGRRMGMASTGSSRRQDYTFAPTSRMTNTFICAGEDDDEKMLAELPEGLYAKDMGGGQVNPLTGEFNFSVTEGYWVKNGDLRPVRSATLIGKGADVLMAIDRVGTRMWMSEGVCGSASGAVPTCVGQPRIRVSGMTIGGKGGAK